MIAEDLRRKIEFGALPEQPDRPLPTENELQKKFAASRNTVRDAIKWLITLGLVETRPGQGTFVVEKPIPFVTTMTLDPRQGENTKPYLAEAATSGHRSTDSEPKVEIQRATRAVAGTLRLDKGAQVVSRHQQRFIDGTPWSLQTTFYPMSLVDRAWTRLILPANISEGPPLISLASVSSSRSDTATRAWSSDEDEAWFFRFPADGRASVFEIHRVGSDENDEPIRPTVTVYPADRNRFRVEVGKVPVTPTANGASCATGQAPSQRPTHTPEQARGGDPCCVHPPIGGLVPGTPHGHTPAQPATPPSTASSTNASPSAPPRRSSRPPQPASSPSSPSS
jgi:GntR family transcriptional regulator